MEFSPKPLKAVSGCSMQKERLQESQKFLQSVVAWKKNSSPELMERIFEHELPLNGYVVFNFSGELLFHFNTQGLFELNFESSVITKALRGMPTVIFNLFENRDWISSVDEFSSALIFPFKSNNLIFVLFSAKEGAFSSRHSYYISSLLELLYI